MLYVIQGDPIPLSRARIGHGSRHMFDAQKDAKRIFAIHIQRQQEEELIDTGPIHLDVVFYMKMPKIKTRNKPNKRFQYHFYKPDLSNLLKFIEDVSNKILFNDDCQIAFITARKVYHEQPRTEFRVIPLKGKYEQGEEKPKT